MPRIVREKGITTPIIYLYWIFYQSLIETRFEMLKSSEHNKLERNSNYK